MRRMVVLLAAILIAAPIVAAQSQTVSDRPHTEQTGAPVIDHGASPFTGFPCADASVDVTSVTMDAADGFLTVTMLMRDFSAKTITCGTGSLERQYPHTAYHFSLRLTAAPENPHAPANGGFTQIAAFSARQLPDDAWSDVMTWTSSASAAGVKVDETGFERVDGGLKWRIPLAGTGEGRNQPESYDIEGMTVARLIIDGASHGADARSTAGPYAEGTNTDGIVGLLYHMTSWFWEHLFPDPLAPIVVTENRAIDTTFTL